MLDKTVPYYNIIMKRTAGIPIPEPKLPNGYFFSFFSEGDEKHWAEIEASVGEFDDQSIALEYFKKEYMVDPHELQRRVIYIQDFRGNYVATITAWWNYTNTRKDCSLHWLSVKPEFQGLGLGKALVYKCLETFGEIDGNKDVFLHTQTWSYKAIGLYLKTGFTIMITDSFGNYINEYEKAVPILRERLKGFDLSD